MYQHEYFMQIVHTSLPSLLDVRASAELPYYCEWPDTALLLRTPGCHSRSASAAETLIVPDQVSVRLTQVACHPI